MYVLRTALGLAPTSQAFKGPRPEIQSVRSIFIISSIVSCSGSSKQMVITFFSILYTETFSIA